MGRPLQVVSSARRTAAASRTGSIFVAAGVALAAGGVAEPFTLGVGSCMGSTGVTLSASGARTDTTAPSLRVGLRPPAAAGVRGAALGVLGDPRP